MLGVVSRCAIAPVCLCLLALAPGAAEAAFPGTNGEIAYVRYDDIWVMNPDGGAGRQLGTGGGYKPAWSPDGQRIAFASRRDGDEEIFVMNADGTGVTQITHNDVADTDPAWSPDGQQIVFASDRDRYGSSADFDVFTMSADGSDPVQLTDNLVWDNQPAWSPDGRRIAYISEQTIWLIAPDGSNRTQLTQKAPISKDDDYSPNWSPDGREIVFSNDFVFIPTVHTVSIHTIDVETREERELTRGLNPSHGPAWSPDGRKVAFSHGFSNDTDVFVMNADGSAATPITHFVSDDDPDWGTHQPSAQPAPDTTGPAMAIARRTVRASRRGVVSVRVRCPAGEPAGCRGRLALRSASRIRGRIVRLGSASFRIAAGRGASVRVRLSRTNRRLLGRRGRLRVLATARASDQAGNAKTTTATFTLNAPRR
jgi:Tol biopolymer transport system component